MKRKILMLSALIIVGGCASIEPLTTVESVQKSQDKVDKTNEFIVRAEKTITEFEKSLQHLMKDASESEEMRGKAKFTAALSLMDRKMAESQRDLAELRISNDESWGIYKQRLNSAKVCVAFSFCFRREYAKKS